MRNLIFIDTILKKISIWKFTELYLAPNMISFIIERGDNKQIYARFIDTVATLAIIRTFDKNRCFGINLARTR